jgi:tetratricopeptide (TPR) repeat protein
MDEVNTELIEQYQKLYEQDPQSKVFATLSEAYRKLGMLQEAKEVAQKGVKHHPQFSSGRVALARIYIDLKQFLNAIDELERSIKLTPENLLAHNLLAECFLHLRKPKEALKAYKTLLFINPDNKKAQNAIQKLESLTADEYEEDIFSMQPIKQAVKDWDQIELVNPDTNANISNPEFKRIRNLERILSLADAYLVRNDTARVLDVLNEGEKLLGSDPEIVRRLKIVHQRQLDQIPTTKNSKELLKPASRERLKLDDKIEFLQDLKSQFIKLRDHSK